MSFTDLRNIILSAMASVAYDRDHPRSTRQARRLSEASSEHLAASAVPSGPTGPVNYAGQVKLDLDFVRAGFLKDSRDRIVAWNHQLNMKLKSTSQDHIGAKKASMRRVTFSPEKRVRIVSRYISKT